MFGFTDQDEPEYPIPNRRRRVKWVVMTFLLAALLSMLPVLVPRLFLGTLAIPTITVMLVLLVFVIVRIAKSAQEDNAVGKPKRGLGGQDMYTLIDRMVDDLDEDELDYLHRRLEDRENAEPDVADSLGELLDQREDARRSGQR